MFSPIFLYWCYSRIFFFSYKRKLLISHFGCLKIMYSLIFFFLILVSVCFPSHFVFPLHQYTPVLNSIANGSRLSESIELESFYGIYFLLFSYYDRFFGFFFPKHQKKTSKYVFLACMWRSFYSCICWCKHWVSTLHQTCQQLRAF